MKTGRNSIWGYILLTFILGILFAVPCVTEKAHAEDIILPVINITSETSYKDVKNEYVEIKMELTAPDHDTETLYNGTAYIHLRGNSTAGLAKKPFRLKLESKSDLLGMGASKHWVLLANAIDLTNIRNLSLQELAGRLGLDYMESKLVELYYNGSYKGVYQLSEHVRIGKTRVNIYDWSDLAEDVADAVTDAFLEKGIFSKDQEKEAREGIRTDLKKDYAWVTDKDKNFYLTTVRNIAGREYWNVDLAEYYDFSEVPAATGGALIEMDFYHNGSADLKTAYKLPLYITSPDHTESTFEALENYLKEYVQAMEYAMHSTDFVYRNSDKHYYNTGEGSYSYSRRKRSGTAYGENDFSSSLYEGCHYTDFVDIDSVINNMLICEISDNWDCMKNSFFMYKDIDSKIVFGPAWDFDWAWGNSMYNIDTAGLWNGTYTYARTWQTTNDYFANEQYYQTQQFNRLLIRDPYFVIKLYERYHEVRDSIIMPFADEYAALCEALTSYNTKNYRQWARTDSAGGSAGYNYKDQLKNTLKFIEERLAWLDEQFTDPETLISSLGYYCSSSFLIASVPDLISSPGNAVITVEVAGTIAKDTAQISFQINGNTFINAPVTNGKATVSIPFETFLADTGTLTTIVFRAVGSEGKYIENRRGTETGVYTNAHSNYVIIDERDIKTEDPLTDEAENTAPENSSNLPDTSHTSTGSESKIQIPVLPIAAAAVCVCTIVTFIIIKKKRAG